MPLEMFNPADESSDKPKDPRAWDPPVVRVPREPTPKEREVHEAPHPPHTEWCEYCTRVERGTRGTAEMARVLALAPGPRKLSQVVKAQFQE